MILPIVLTHFCASAKATTRTDVSGSMIRMTATAAAHDVHLVSAMLSLRGCSFHSPGKLGSIYKAYGFVLIELIHLMAHAIRHAIHDVIGHS